VTNVDLPTHVTLTANTVKTVDINGAWGRLQRANLDRRTLVTNTAALTTQVMTSVAIPLEVGDVVTNLTFLSGATAAGTPTTGGSRCTTPRRRLR
jgi:hypothetical protein